MVAYDFKADAAREQLLGKMKRRYEPGAMRPQLCLLDADARDRSASAKKSADDLRYQWMVYAGMGNVDFMPVAADVVAAAKELLARGQIAPSFPDNYYGIAYRPLRLVEDLNWGFRTDGAVVIFSLSGHAGIADRVITPDATYDAAIDEMKKRIEYSAASFDRPIRLSDGTEITPVIFGQEQLLIRGRQNDYKPA